MNTNSNTYTVIYSIGLVVVVAAVLAFVAKFLQPMQEENVKKDTISQILTAADIKFTDDNVLEVYKDSIKLAFTVNQEGVPTDTLETKDIKNLQVYSTSDLKEQLTKQNAFPVYEFENVVVIPCYGAGLWGPIWGYVGVSKADYATITKACFGHKGETPGLGAKITDERPVFADHFANKQIIRDSITVNKETGKKEIEKSGFYFEVAKTNSRKPEAINNGVDAISGATITSQAVGKALNTWFGFYQGYFSTKAPIYAETTTDEQKN